jgi:hypothetical protein
MSPHPRFDPASVGSFRITTRRVDPTTRRLSLGYEFDHGPRFEETVTFETPPGDRGAEAGWSEQPGFLRALLHLHVAAGTSYYKVAAPPEVVVEGATLTPDEVEFQRHLYDDGLREFAVTNALPVPRPVAILAGRAEPSRPAAVSRPGGLLVPIGGGKDSMVLIDAVAGMAPRLFSVNPHPRVTALAARTGLDLIVVRRALAPELGELNGSGALNGHVPITAIVSLIAVVGSFLYGYDTIAMAVERSASEETVLVGDTPVNHQYSKSLGFERLLRQLVAGAIDPGLSYGSPLRPYSELAIARAFAGLPRFHDTFCSCNTIFRASAGADDGWCGACPKCRFVALMLAPFLDRSAVTAIIGRDMFEDPGQVAGFAALMSDDDKPFECVGERRESAAALRLLSESDGWRETPVVAALAGRARALVSGSEVHELLQPRSDLACADPEIAAALARSLAAPR